MLATPSSTRNFTSNSIHPALHNAQGMDLSASSLAKTAVIAPSRSHPGKALKNFFSRSAALATDRKDGSRPRPRLLSATGSSKPVTTLQAIGSSHHSIFSYGQGEQGNPSGRSHTPEPAVQHDTYLSPSDYPAMRKDDTGKWQAPTLSKGSVSTSDVNRYHADGESDIKALVSTPPKNRRPRQGTLDAMFDRTSVGRRKSGTWGQERMEIPADAGHSAAQVVAKDKAAARSQDIASVSLSVTNRDQSVEAETNGNMLSREHYQLRLTASYIIKVLGLGLITTTSQKNEKTRRLQGLAKGRLQELTALERGWGSEWTRTIAVLDNNGAPLVPVEDKIRSVNASEQEKARERKIWAKTLQDGIILCFLLNHLFPQEPSHIARVNTSEEELARATNVSRFLAACEKLDVSIPLFKPSDLSDCTELSLGKVSATLLALIRFAGPAGLRPARSLSARLSGHAPQSTGQPRLSNDLQVNPYSSIHTVETLDIRPPQVAISDVEPRFAPSTSALGTTASLSPPPHASRRLISRASTQPLPVVPRSPLGSPPTDVSRPFIRPRSTRITLIPTLADHTHSLGSSTLNQDGSTRSPKHAHLRERTPSLISQGSGQTAYTRSSTAFSIATVLGEDQTSVLELSGNDSQPGSYASRVRRLSEITLHDARQKIMGTLLKSSDDLPDQYRQALEDEGRDRARAFALSVSLAALEGNTADHSKGSRHLASTRGRHSFETGRQDINISVVEEDENERDSPAGENGPIRRPSLLKRLPSNSSGKIYVPKRSNSPGSVISSANPGGFPFPAMDPESAGHLDGDAEEMAAEPTAKDKTFSEGMPYRSFDQRPSSRLTGQRANSMAELPSTSRFDPPSVFTDRSEGGVHGLRMRQQVLSFNVGEQDIQYQVGNCIGRGQFGSVYRSLNLQSGQMVAIKRIRLAGMEERQVREVMQEVELMQRLSHPSIVKYEMMSREDDHLNIVLEFVENGSLGQTLKAFGQFNEKLVGSYVAKIIEGLIYLHSQGVVHCDLKAANILSTKNGNIKLSDFGVSLNLRAVEHITHEAVTASRAGGRAKAMSEVAGTPNWMAPEVISLSGASFASDIWSLGCTIIELLTGKPPYHDVSNSMTVLFRIVEDTTPPLPEGSDELIDFLKLCFTKNPSERPTAALLSLHPWIQLSLDTESKLVRPQDSVPFIRRISLDMKPSNYSRSVTPVQDDPSFGDLSADRSRRYARRSWASSADRGSPRSITAARRSHNLIKTSFSKAVTCRVCHGSIKKNGILCQECGLLCHAECATRALATFDSQEQLAAFTRNQEEDNEGDSRVSAGLNSPHLSSIPFPSSFPLSARRRSDGPDATATSIIGNLPDGGDGQRPRSREARNVVRPYDPTTIVSTVEERQLIASPTIPHVLVESPHIGAQPERTRDRPSQAMNFGAIPMTHEAGAGVSRPRRQRMRNSKSECCIM